MENKDLKIVTLHSVREIEDFVKKHEIKPDTIIYCKETDDYLVFYYDEPKDASELKP